jgi:hypothetical protein
MGHVKKTKSDSTDAMVLLSVRRGLYLFMFSM